MTLSKHVRLSLIVYHLCFRELNCLHNVTRGLSLIAAHHLHQMTKLVLQWCLLLFEACLAVSSRPIWVGPN